MTSITSSSRWRENVCLLGLVLVSMVFAFMAITYNDTLPPPVPKTDSFKPRLSIETVELVRVEGRQFIRELNMIPVLWPKDSVDAPPTMLRSGEFFLEVPPETADFAPGTKAEVTCSITGILPQEQGVAE